jgi:hypothetical protein
MPTHDYPPVRFSTEEPRTFHSFIQIEFSTVPVTGPHERTNDYWKLSEASSTPLLGSTAIFEFNGARAIHIIVGSHSDPEAGAQQQSAT